MHHWVEEVEVQSRRRSQQTLGMAKQVRMLKKQEAQGDALEASWAELAEVDKQRLCNMR